MPPPTANPEILWPLRAQFPALRAGDVHVWCVRLDEEEEDAGPLSKSLSDAERRRALRLRFPLDRRRFVAAHARLREILARYLAVAPEELHFDHGRCGKPALVHPDAGRELQFNLSHSGALALCAVTRQGAVGVDLEQVRPLADLASIATRFFSPAETSWLLRLEPERRRETFFQLWTQKEALVKARGANLDELLLAVDFTSAARHPAGDGGAASPWVVTRLQPANGYVGAVALAGPAPRLHLWQWASGAVEEAWRDAPRFAPGPQAVRS